MNVQLVGAVLLIIGAALLWSPWAFVIGGALVVLVPELVAAGRRRAK